MAHSWKVQRSLVANVQSVATSKEKMVVENSWSAMVAMANSSPAQTIRSVNILNKMKKREKRSPQAFHVDGAKTASWRNDVVVSVCSTHVPTTLTVNMRSKPNQLVIVAHFATNSWWKGRRPYPKDVLLKRVQTTILTNSTKKKVRSNHFDFLWRKI